MSIRTHISDQILPFVEGALAGGLRVFVPKQDQACVSPVGFAYVCKDIDGGFATINAACNRIEPTYLTAPVKPHRDHGSAVLVDYDDTVAGAVEALAATCASDRVVTRFVKNPALVANYGRRVLDNWPSSPDAFVEVTVESLAAADGGVSAASTPSPAQKELAHA